MTVPLYSPRPGVQSSAFDMTGLATLKRDAQEGAKVDTREEIARQFEALYLQMMLKRMREATPRSGMLDSDQTRMVQSMGDEQMAMQLSRPGIGLADALMRQMARSDGTLPDAQQPGAKEGVLAATSANALDLGASSRSAQEKSASFDTISDGLAPDVTALLNVLMRRDGAPEPLSASANAPVHVAEFVDKMGEAAQTASMQSGVPARLILGQAALESGWGKREIKFADGTTSYNVFGIKAGGSWTGRVAHVMTTEYIDGQPQKMLQPFRAYGSYEEAFTDYAKLIGNSARYERVTQTDDDVEAARLIHRAGYATDPRYADKLISIMDLMRGSPELVAQR